ATVGGAVYKVLPGNAPGSERGREPGSADILPASAPIFKSVLTSKVDTEQGLPSQNSFAVISIPGTSNNGGLWIGTNRGVAHYLPSLVAPVLNVSRVIGKRIFL